MPGCLQAIIYIIVEVIIGRVIDEIIKRLTGRRIRGLGFLTMLLALFGIRLRSNSNLSTKR
jgi:hypothetical protein